jgi:hypothetical protein
MWRAPAARSRPFSPTSPTQYLAPRARGLTFGSTRSGSTWLLRLLCHPLTLDANDGLGFSLPVEAPGGPRLDALPVNEFLLDHLAPQATPFGRRTVSMCRGPSTASGPRIRAMPWRMTSRTPGGPRCALRARPPARRGRAGATRFQLADDPAVVIKDVGTSHAADATMALLPRSRFLFLVRDGRDVIDSLVHAALAGYRFSRVAKPLISSDEDRAGVRVRAGDRLGVLDGHLPGGPGRRIRRTCAAWSVTRSFSPLRLRNAADLRFRPARPAAGQRMPLR